MQPYEQLEQRWAEFNQLDPVGMVACSSGTAALHLALEALRLPAWSEVLCGDYNMVAVPRAVVLAGLTPVFVDCGPDLNVDPHLVNYAIGLGDRPPAAVLVTHVYGRRADLDGCGDVPVGTRVVEDLAEAHGVHPHPDTDAACWSFFANKHVHGEEGGAVWFRDPAHAVLAKQLRCLGFTADHNYNHTPRGHNYRLANALADLILRSLREFDGEMDRRRAAEAVLNSVCPPEWRMPPRSGPWVYDLRIPGLSGEMQTQLVTELRGAGVAARYGFKPMSSQEEFRKCRTIAGGSALAASREVIYLPMRVDSVVGMRIIRSRLGTPDI